MTDADYLVVTIYGEARGEPVEGKIAVACVLRNRLRTARWGGTYESVALAPWQFSCWRLEGGADNFRAVMKLKDAIEKGLPVSDPIFDEIRWIVSGLMTGALRDRVNGSTHYFAAASPVPKWALNRLPECKVASHWFFRGIQ